ncbi:MAG: DUF1080 domain-containing protein [Bacteroidota bacterium]|nr:DUF1080 domain-containing protein [Bacteroidota bacterium]
MRLLFILSIILLPALMAPASAARQWQTLVTGGDLSAWHQLGGEATYEAVDGEVIGTTVANTPNTFLATRATFGDFALSLEVKVDPDINSGIQIRSESNPEYLNGRVHGYQIEIDPTPRAWSGGVYDEARRGWLYPLSVNEDCRQAFNREGWNHYYIEALGSFIRTWVNDVACAALNDAITAEGFIALQVHSVASGDMAGRTVQWRNIRLTTGDIAARPWTDNYVVNLVPNTLTEQEKAQGFELLFDGASTDGWRGAGKEEFPARGWRVEDGVLMVEASGGAEAAFGGDIVTVDEYATFEFSLEFKLTEGANSGIKYFITESYGSDASAIGLEYQLLDDEKHPDATQGAGGNRTLASLYDLIPADDAKTVHRPGEWNRARLIVTGTRLEERVMGSRMKQSMFVGAHVEHWLNDRKVLEYERGTQAFDALVARSKYVVWGGFGLWPQGHILLQDHGDEVHFRSIKIRRID